MTPEDVHHITFATAPWGRPGYKTDDVDDLLDHIAAALAGRADLDAERLQRGFRPGSTWLNRGYQPDEVDDFLRRVRGEFKV
ncbi:DivIVA domain-containing protein [Nocardia speluncae]|uniref:DivIVA domain-containing protein n=1 Tax=Nocardia speluncae TaxID=419477 RepID=A0A846X9T2_9NOCA|nr:DivIVA domain-containing protein [Nocardia speluncae]NKY32748.1 DivIVA domain-containing protein [Nocardia speluncae]